MNGYLIDFGVAKHLKDEDFEQTTTGAKGTLHYKAPELSRTRAEQLECKFIDLFACDMWSFGVTIFEAVTNKLPFEGNGLKYKNNTKDPNVAIPCLPEKSHPILKFVVERLLERDSKK